MTDIRRNVGLFSAAHFLQMALFLMGLVNYPHFLTNVHAYSNKFAGALVGILAVSNLAAVFPLGLLSDRVSPKKLYGGSLGCVILFYTLFPLCTGKVLLVILFAAGGIGFAALRIFLRVLYYKYLPDSQRSKNISVFFSAGFLGFAAGGLAGGYMQDLGSMLSVPALPFFAAAGLTAVLAAWTLVIPDSLPEKIRFAEYVRDIRNVKVLMIIGIFILMGLHYGVEQYGFPKLAQEGLGLSAKKMGHLYLGIGVMLGGLAFIFREFFEKREKHFYYFGVALIISGLFQTGTFFAQDFSSLLLLRLGHVAGDTLIILMSGIVIVGLFPGSRMGGNVGFINLLNTMGQFGGSFLAGYAIDRDIGAGHRMWSPYFAAFTLSGIVMIATGMGFILLRKKLGVAGGRQESITYKV